MGEGHSHDHGRAPRASRQVRLILALALLPFALATVVGMVVLWPEGEGQSVVTSP